MNPLPKMCDYKVTGFVPCGHRAHYVIARTGKTAQHMRFIYLCADHATADAICWPSQEATALILGKTHEVCHDR